jgi:protein involved in polysaccharide export with SLBB domain
MRNQPTQPDPITRPLYVIAPRDSILLHAPRVEKLNGRIFQVDSMGFVRMPALGRVRATGFTLEAFEKNLARRFKRNLPGEPRYPSKKSLSVTK